MVNPFLASGSPALTGAQVADYGDANYSSLYKTSYRGAFAAGDNWLDGWSKVSAAQLIGALPVLEVTETVSANITSDTTWTKGTTYLLTDYIFVEPGATLIQAGTTIKEPRYRDTSSLDRFSR